MTDHERKVIEALLGHRLTDEAVAELRRAAARTEARAALSRHFTEALNSFRVANPASVSPRWGFA